VLDVAMTDATPGWAAKPPIATSVDQIRRNAEAVAWAPTPDDLRAIDEIAPSARS
jgi:aryl-alcohol dehydrogenase-like predicted oxidoreductase